MIACDQYHLRSYSPLVLDCGRRIPDSLTLLTIPLFEFNTSVRVQPFYLALMNAAYEIYGWRWC